ncbi:choice-of-anchor C family protein [Tateyamaria armeniaca]|uniref:Choice-of-anchor C family protein n=1 Tax=Tateyamaria armeniaca TaxID=2518930 RepID=A0ABW8UXJ9_9RHOB
MKSLIVSAVLGLGAAQMASAATIVNGSFEDPDVTGAFATFVSGSTAITGWTVGSGSVDVVDTLWIAQEGSQAVDLDGSAVGSIFQTITDLIVGTSYTISFYMSGNPDGPPPVKSMDVSVGANTAGYTFDMSGGNAETGVWELNTFTFTAAATSEVLTFASTTGGSAYGAAVDDVSIAPSIAPVPLPAGGLMLVGGLVGLAALRRRRQQG